MSSTSDGFSRPRRKKELTAAFLIAATVLVTASLFAILGTSMRLAPANAQTMLQQTNSTQQQNQTSTASTSNTTSPFSAAIERLREQARLHEQQQAAMNLTGETKQKARDVSNAVDGVLIYYARAIGEKNKEPVNITATTAAVPDVRIPAVPLTGLDEANMTSANGSKIVSQADYLIAQGLALKALESFAEVSASAAQTADPTTMQQLADTQEGLVIIYGLVQSKAPYNLVEDIAISPVRTNLEHIYSATTSTIS